PESRRRSGGRHRLADGPDAYHGRTLAGGQQSRGRREPRGRQRFFAGRGSANLQVTDGESLDSERWSGGVQEPTRGERLPRRRPAGSEPRREEADGRFGEGLG